MHFTYLPTAELGFNHLSEEESFHCVKVLRMKSGDEIAVSNGLGKIFKGQLVEEHPKKAVVELTTSENGYDHWDFYSHIAIAPTKNIDRLEWFVEKAVEIGLNEISLFTSFHSERKHLRLDRLEKIMQSALKQSKKSFLPKLNPLITFDQFVRHHREGEKYIAYIDETVHETLVSVLQPSSGYTVMIGPEGDFSKEEVSLAKTYGYQPVSLGDARLRTETAGVVACHTIQLINKLGK